MRTHYNLYENILNDSMNEVMTSRILLTNVCDGFKVYKKLLPKLSTRVVWLATKSCMPISPLEIRSRR